MNPDDLISANTNLFFIEQLVQIIYYNILVLYRVFEVCAALVQHHTKNSITQLLTLKIVCSVFCLYKQHFLLC